MGKITNLKKILFISVLSAAAICRIASGAVIYVDDDEPADFNNIQEAIDAASTGDTVLVDDGTYTGVGNRDIDFHGKAITVRSENGPDNCIIDCQATITNLHRGFYFHNNEGSSSVVMGFTITRGYADGGGGGVYCDSSDPTITNCNFVGNLAKSGGGGIYNKGSQPIVTNCIFMNNGTYPSGFGGGMHNYCSSPTIIRCKFEGNYTSLYGGGMGNVDSSPLVINCAFIRNFGPGAGMFNTSYCNPTVVNCAFVGNRIGLGAGMYNVAECNPTLINCTFTGNWSDRYGGGISNRDSVATVINSIFWGNKDKDGDGETSQIYGGTLIINYSCVQGWTGAFGGTGNIGDDPLLVDIDGPDDILGTADDNPHLLPDSPCVNTGSHGGLLADSVDLDNDGDTIEPIPWDLDSNPRFINEIVDMGAYEYQPPRTLYVDPDAIGLADGSSWTNAYTNLQDALAIARYGDDIWVSEGIYKPDRGTGITPGDRTSSFALSSGVCIYGGFQGILPTEPGMPSPPGETVRDQRDASTHLVILSGDLNGNDVGGLFHPSRNENSYHVVNGSAADASTILDGFTITGGNANGDEGYNNGGGMYNQHGSPTIINCVFSSNSANGNGGGLFTGERSQPTIIKCQFLGNLAALEGGAVYGTGTGPTSLTNCTFSGNLASNGASLACDSLLQEQPSDIQAVNCIFRCETMPPPGPASNPNPANGVTGVSTSTDLHWSAGIYSTSHDVYFGTSSVPPYICNQPDTKYDPGTLALETMYYWRIDELNPWGKTVGPVWSFKTGSISPPPEETVNSLFASMSHEIYNADNSIITIVYSNIGGGWPGEGNIDADPCFVMQGYWDANGTPDDANDDFRENGDYYLKSQAGRWDPNSESWVQDDITSPCIDAGDPMSPIGPEPFPNGGRINMGAYGGTVRASKSYFGEPVCETVIAGDINGDCRIDFLDFRLMLFNWLEDNVPPLPPPGQSSEPNPPDGVIDVDITVDLSWTAGLYTNSHDVYFGMTNPPPFVRNQTTTTFDPGLMFSQTQYYWRIDEINATGTTIGAIWSFTTISLEAMNPNPSNGAVGVDLNADVSWTAGSYATSHDVYFGTSNPPPFIGNQISTTFDPGTMAYDTTYYWRIDEVNNWGTSAGTVWGFTTKVSPPP